MSEREHPGEMWHGANHLPWAADPIAQSVVRARGERGFTLSEIGAVLDVTHQAASLIAQKALAKLRAANPEDLRAMLDGASEELRCAIETGGGFAYEEWEVVE